MTTIFFEIELPEKLKDSTGDIAENLTAAMIKAVTELKEDNDGIKMKYKLGYILSNDNAVEF